ncbi:hypothetical protein IJG76_01135 [Candidatus Saccharibacteria bacterium]|nr:hypothetical protein [Candidatus Saccharibacteria bacterium]
MNIRQVKEFFEDKKNTPCPLTERLIKAGYQQTSDGYIDLAKKRGITVDYTKAEPIQYWHLIEEYIPSVPENKMFSKSIVCGELIFWMAEVSKAVSESELEDLLEGISADGDKSSTPLEYDRIKWNKEIQNLCFDAIVNTVEKQ